MEKSPGDSDYPIAYSPTYPVPASEHKDITFMKKDPGASAHFSGNGSIFNPDRLSTPKNPSEEEEGEEEEEHDQNIDNLYQHSQEKHSGSEMQKSIKGEISHRSEISQGQLQANIKTLQRLWQYRYVRLVDNAIYTNDWFRLLSFVCEFKEKCIKLVKDMIYQGLESIKKIDEIDHRFTLKGDGEEGIFLVEGIIIRIARIKSKKVENGNMGFDYSAMKALHQEFLSLNILNNLSISLVKEMPKLPRIRVPLTCLVKYMGYTALCQADSPCEGLQTLVHGPTGTIYQYRQQYMDLLRVIGHNLNLKQFTMLSSDKKSVTIPFSLTLQLHKITKHLSHQRLLNIIDKSSVLYPKNESIQLQQPEFYLMSVAKLWPLFIDSDIIKSVGYVRPEVVISSRTPLSNVVFCQISEKPDPEGELELADACKRVKEDHISALAKMLDNTTVFLVDSQGIEDLLHQYGINIRYMGSLAEKVNLQFNKRILQTEMIARTCKRYFFKTFHQMTNEMKMRGKDLQKQFNACFVDFLNLIFIKSKQAQQFYRNYIYPQVLKYYDYKIAAYPPQMQGGGILHAICYHFGFKIKIIDYPFFQTVQTIFNSAHIIYFQGSAKCYDFQTAEIKEVTRKYKDKRKRGRLDECIKQLKILAKIHQVQGNQHIEPIGPLPEAYFLIELAEVYFKMKDIETAKKYAEDALKVIPEKHSDAVRAFQILLKYYSQKKEVNKGVEFYEKSLNYLSYHLGINHPLTITVYNSFAYEQLDTNDSSKCQKIFLKSLQICQHSLGYTHATSSQLLLNLARLPLPPEKKINYYLQGLNVLQNLDVGEAHGQKVQIVCKQLAEIYEKVGNLQKMISFAKRSKYWQLQIKGESKQESHRNVLMLANRIPDSVSECSYITFYAFRSYVKLLPKATREYLYKLFVSIRDKLAPRLEAQRYFFESLKIDKSSTLFVTEQLKNVITHLTSQLPALINKPTFYRDISKAIDPEDKKLQNSIQIFTDIIAVVGEDKAEKFLIEQVKTF